MLLLPRAELEKIHRHARETWPEECCGFLIGREGEPRAVTEARAARNVHPDSRETRYTIDPLETLRLDRELRGTDRVHLGFYHSHPGYPPQPSAFDLERAWSGYTYLIVALEAREMREAQAWRLDAARARLEEEPMTVHGPQGSSMGQPCPSPGGGRHGEE
ncbi:MAG TPA: M67 family metallopeptidase [Thermoplasmata archaeon]|nr:M67 family metallopeptidase [Thermoplasmata archaeon]